MTEYLLTGFLRKSVVDDAFNIDLEVGIAKRDLMPLLFKFLEDAGQDAIDLMGSDRKYRMTPKMQGLINERVDLFARSINKTTKDKLQQVLANHLSDGGTLKDLAKEIQSTYQGISKGRAFTIARTETAVASQSGQFDGYKQAGVSIKIWVAVMDDRTRDSHAELDGEEQPIDREFSNGLMFPNDPTGSTEEVINCRCSI